MDIRVYVCPTPGCGDYFGHTDMPDLAAATTGPKTEDRHQVSQLESRVNVAGKRHSRAECPSCRERGVFVERILCSISIDVSNLRSAPADAA